MHSGPPHTTQLLSTYTPWTRGVTTFILFVLMPVKHTRKDVKLQQQGNKREMSDYKTWHDIQRAQMIHVVTWKEFMQQNRNRSDNRKVQKEAAMRKCQSVEVAPLFFETKKKKKKKKNCCSVHSGAGQSPNLIKAASSNEGSPHPWCTFGLLCQRNAIKFFLHFVALIRC